MLDLAVSEFLSFKVVQPMLQRTGDDNDFSQTNVDSIKSNIEHVKETCGDKKRQHYFSAEDIVVPESVVLVYSVISNRSC